MVPSVSKTWMALMFGSWLLARRRIASPLATSPRLSPRSVAEVKSWAEVAATISIRSSTESARKEVNFSWASPASAAISAMTSAVRASIS